MGWRLVELLSDVLCEPVTAMCLRRVPTFEVVFTCAGSVRNAEGLLVAMWAAVKQLVNEAV